MKLAKHAATIAFDTLVHPPISAFCMNVALRMDKSDVLRGGTMAAHTVLDAYRSRLRGDSSRLDDLVASGALDPNLHACLSDPAQDQAMRFATDSRVPFGEVLESATRRLHAASENFAVATEVSGTVRLVVGARRSTYPDRAFVRKYKCTLGTHLVVIDTAKHGLASSERQRELLWLGGCTVQCLLRFQAPPFSSAPPLSVVLEADFGGEALTEDEPGAAEYYQGPGYRSAAHDVQFSVVDVNGVLGGNQFWAGADEVAGWHQLLTPEHPPARGVPASPRARTTGLPTLRRAYRATPTTPSPPRHRD